MSEQVLVSQKFLEEVCPNVNWSFAIDLFRMNTKATLIRSFTNQILHGDEKHRAWLLQAAEDFIADKPIQLEHKE